MKGKNSISCFDTTQFHAEKREIKQFSYIAISELSFTSQHVSLTY